ncbi:hypothetical protein BAE44_0011441 [Dichanthelium oligosanthes]|uniref:Uncharacterized protein n=1 Tax=Dichanthelium oligosanthes TaxID=888268 RepID=A0A1E5VQY8_9POAL|nr:hypothetical protein BAE44_0011441 [Dichanthelium oligosanthes]
MMNALSSHHRQHLQLPVQDLSLNLRGRSFISSKAKECPPASSCCSSAAGRCSMGHPHTRSICRRHRGPLVAVTRASNDDRGGESESSSSSDGGGGKDDDEEAADDDEIGFLSRREDLERLVGPDDDAKFNGLDLANLIRKKYGRSYDVTLIKKEFMGRNLLAMNVMWKYREQRSFPLSEEEYLLRLDEVANTLKCWGAVAHVRNTLEKLKERPRIGKAVSIFIDMDQTGGRANEWIYK